MKLLGYSLILLLTCGVFAQNVTMQKDIEKSFYAPEGSRFDLVNKYGEVIVRTWDEDSVFLSVVMQAEGRTTEAVQKNINKIRVQFRQVGKIISATTEINTGKSGFFKDLLGEVDDYSRGVFGGGKLTINYEVWLPNEVDLNVENKFGNIYLADLESRVTIDLSHGDLKAGSLGETVSLKHSFGKSDIESFTSGTAILRGAELKAATVKDLDIESSSSEIYLDKIDQFQFNSRNDKITVNEAQQVLGEGVFTDFKVDFLIKQGNLDFKYGDVFITRVERNFKSLDILSENADINLILDQASYISADITGPENKMIIPNSMLTLQRSVLPETGAIKLKGMVGNTQVKFSDLTIKNDGGKLIISINELPLFSEKD